MHQENVDKDVDRVGCVSLGRSINLKVLASVQSVHAGVEVQFDKRSNSTSTPAWTGLYAVTALKKCVFRALLDDWFLLLERCSLASADKDMHWVKPTVGLGVKLTHLYFTIKW